MSWNCEKNKISEDKLDGLSETEKLEIQDNWKTVYNPDTNKITYVNPEAYNDLRAALLATVPFQPQTFLEEMENTK
jgi:hypothetical protein